MIPGKAREDLVSGLGTVAGSCARICLMAYLKIKIKKQTKTLLQTKTNAQTRIDDNLHIVEQPPVSELSLQLAPLVLAHLVEGLKLAYLAEGIKEFTKTLNNKKETEPR